MKKTVYLALLLGALAGCKSKPVDPAGGGGNGGGTQQPPPGSFDPTTIIEAPARLSICPDARVGWMVEKTTTQGGTTLVESYAIVGDTGAAWQVETRWLGVEGMALSYPELGGKLLGLTVRKSDGTVTAAVIGKPGEAGKPVKIGAAQEAQQPGTPERVSIGALGTLEAHRTTFPGAGATVWVGTTGDYQGIVLKSQGPNADYELTAPPARDARDVGGVSVSVLGTVYSNGMKLWYTSHDVLACLPTGGAGPDGKRNAVFRTEMAGSVAEVTAIRTDATPRLTW